MQLRLNVLQDFVPTVLKSSCKAYRTRLPKCAHICTKMLQTPSLPRKKRLTAQNVGISKQLQKPSYTSPMQEVQIQSLQLCKGYSRNKSCSRTLYKTTRSLEHVTQTAATLDSHTGAHLVTLASSWALFNAFITEAGRESRLVLSAKLA